MGFSFGDFGDLAGGIGDLVGAGAGALGLVTGPTGTDKSQLIARVNDARAAGVHPLFALGAPLPGPSGTGLPQMQALGQIGDSVANIGARASNRAARSQAQASAARQESRADRVSEAQITEAMARARAAEAQAQRDIVEAQYRLSQMARTVQNTNAQQDHTRRAFDEKPPPSVTTPWGEFLLNPEMTNAETYQNVFGELMEWIMTIPLLIEHSRYSREKKGLIGPDAQRRTIEKLPPSPWGQIGGGS